MKNKFKLHFMFLIFIVVFSMESIITYAAQPSPQSGTGTNSYSGSSVYRTIGFSLMFGGVTTSLSVYSPSGASDPAVLYFSDDNNRKYSDGFNVDVESGNGNRRVAYASYQVQMSDGSWKWNNYALLINPANFNPNSLVVGRSLLDNLFLEVQGDATKTANLKTALSSDGTAWVNEIISARKSSGAVHSRMATGKLWKYGSSNYTNPAMAFSTDSIIGNFNWNSYTRNSALPKFYHNKFEFRAMPEFISNVPGVNLTAKYLDLGIFFVGDSTVEAGVNVKNYSNPSAAYPDVKTKITFLGKDYIVKTSIDAPAVIPNGVSFKFALDAPTAKGDYLVKINVNYDHSVKEELPIGYIDNIVQGFIHVEELPSPVTVTGRVDLNTYAVLTGLDSSNRIKSGYGFGIKLNGSNNLGEVKAENFYYKDLPGHNHYVKVKSVDISSIDNFGIQSNSSNLKFIIGNANNQLRTTSVMLLPSHRGILNWDFGSKSKPVNVTKDGQVFTFKLDNNTYGASGNKPLIYLPVTTQDTTPGSNYTVTVGGGSAQVTYHMYEYWETWSPPYTDPGPPPKPVAGSWDGDSSSWTDGPYTIGVKTTSLPISVKGSMFDDDANSVN